MSDSPTFAQLKEKQRKIRAGFDENLGLRVHRSISWIGRADDCNDDDARFIFLWIAFNAAYADQNMLQPPASTTRERTLFFDYFTKLVAHDAERRIYEAIWQRFSGPIRVLMKNHYIYSPFWQHHNGIAGHAEWKKWFQGAARQFNKAFQRNDSVRVLATIFDRLYVLRNQLLHGGATWNSQVNRAQVRDGTAILAFLTPIFIDLMMDNPQENWGQPLYPVVG
ncbi:MAG: hypothetical protein GDA55_01910 [Cellvibrionales bacterium]|nr:hypothetical protein [Cellvibrionales bacterium]